MRCSDIISSLKDIQNVDYLSHPAWFDTSTPFLSVSWTVLSLVVFLFGNEKVISELLMIIVCCGSCYIKAIFGMLVIY